MSDIHVISENDLQDAKLVGDQIRALCPIHHSHDPDLSITPHGWNLGEDDNKYAGFGHCFSAKCGAKVLVQEWNPQAAARILGHAVKPTVPRFTMSAHRIKEATAWQQRELAALNKIYPCAAEYLRKPRPCEYLAARGLGRQEALELLEVLGVAYIPPVWEWNSPPPVELQKWCDRIIFSSTCSNGERGYAGRTLEQWFPGMDENQHKIALTNYNRDMERLLGKDRARYEVHRWRKTYRNGIFNAVIMREHDHLYICEGAFDAIPLLLEGLPNVVAVIGTQIDIQAIPKNVFDVTLAFDADVEGTDSVKKTMDLLASVGIMAKLCSPPADGRGKDWSERYRCYGREGLVDVMAMADAIGKADAIPKGHTVNRVPTISTDKSGSALASAELVERSLFENLHEFEKPPQACYDCKSPIVADDLDYFYWPGSAKTELHYFTYCTGCSAIKTDQLQRISVEPQIVKDPVQVEQLKLWEFAAEIGFSKEDITVESDEWEYFTI